MDKYAGHSSLAEMVSTHIEVWRDQLKNRLEYLQSIGADDFSYVQHELKALDAIEKACELDRGL